MNRKRKKIFFFTILQIFRFCFSIFMNLGVDMRIGPGLNINIVSKTKMKNSTIKKFSIQIFVRIRINNRSFF